MSEWPRPWYRSSVAATGLRRPSRVPPTRAAPPVVSRRRRTGSGERSDRSDDPTDQSSHPEDHQVSGQASEHVGESLPAGYRRPGEEVIGDGTQERDEEDHGRPAYEGSLSDLTAGEIPEGDADPGRVQHERQEVGVQAEQDAGNRCEHDSKHVDSSLSVDYQTGWQLGDLDRLQIGGGEHTDRDRKSTRLNSS